MRIIKFALLAVLVSLFHSYSTTGTAQQLDENAILAHVQMEANILKLAKVNVQLLSCHKKSDIEEILTLPKAEGMTFLGAMLKDARCTWGRSVWVQIAEITSYVHEEGTAIHYCIFKIIVLPGEEATEGVPMYSFKRIFTDKLLEVCGRAST